MSLGEAQVSLRLGMREGNDGDDLDEGSGSDLKETCPICNRKFRRKWNLKAHFRVHTGAEPYSCSEPGCTKKFKWSSSLQYHRKTHELEGSSSRDRGGPSDSKRIRRDDQAPEASSRAAPSSSGEPTKEKEEAQSAEESARRTSDRETNPMSINFLTVDRVDTKEDSDDT